MRNADQGDAETITESITEYKADPANLYYRQGIHALRNKQFQLAKDQFERAKSLAGADNQATLDKFLKQAEDGLAAGKAAQGGAAPAAPAPDEVKARNVAQQHLDLATVAHAKGLGQYKGKAWELAYASFAEALAEIDTALKSLPGDATLTQRRTETSHALALAAFQQGLVLEAGVPEPSVTFADGKPFIKPRPVQAMEWLEKATRAWPEQTSIKDRYEWHVKNTPIGPAP